MPSSLQWSRVKRFGKSTEAKSSLIFPAFSSPFSPYPQTWPTIVQEPLRSFPSSLKKKKSGSPSLVIYPEHCSALQIQSGFFCHCIYNPNSLEWFPVLCFRKTLAICMSERTLLLVISISQRLQTKIFTHLLQSIFGTDA